MTLGGCIVIECSHNMKVNVNTVIQGSKCILVPYRREHVERYHVWMRDPFLQQTTESEPLTMEKEYEMQASWREDEDKCTFIVLDPSLQPTDGDSSHPVHRQLALMAGDVNLYFNDHDDHSTAEIEVMVAEPGSRRKGIAQEALQLMMAYAVQQLSVTCFRAKILEDNLPSIALFQKLGYHEAKRVAVFQEVHMELDVRPDSEAYQQLMKQALHCGTYDGNDSV